MRGSDGVAAPGAAAPDAAAAAAVAPGASAAADPRRHDGTLHAAIFAGLVALVVAAPFLA